ncbi:hypothetical protein [Mycobacteroides abscessus]|uniref:hypothetical protein n=1 Tax=Mycobacteroides abscessus TaxID=36809 RepID=UPI001F39DE6C|nr:hypothetical protein [Mycobacteroides abscessus]
MGASPAGGAEGTGAAPEAPGVMPVDTGTLGVLGAVLVGSWEAVAELVTAVAMSAAAAGALGSVIDGMRGSPVGLIC